MFSTNSGEQQIDTIMWLGAIGSTSNTSPISDFSTNLQFNNDGRYFGNVCGNCEALTPENHCFDCSDSLCNRCVILHLSNFSNKHHTIQKINNSSPPNAINRLTATTFASPKLDMNNQCDIHYEILRYVCEFCKTIICQECSLRDHKEHQCTSIDKYVERPQITIQILMEKASSGKQQIKQNIDRILQFTQHLDRDTNDIIQRCRKNTLRTPIGSINSTLNNAMLRSDEQDRAVCEIIEKFRQQKLANFHDQTSGLRAALAGIASVTDDLKKMLCTLHEMPAFELAKSLIDADNKIEHFLKQTRKLAPSPVDVNQFLNSLERKNDQLIVSSLQHLVQNNANMLRPDIAALVASTSQMSIMANNNAITKSIRRPIVRSNRGFQQNNNPQSLLQSTLNQQQQHNPIISNSWNIPNVSNNDLILNYNGFNASQTPFPGNNLNHLNDEPLAFGQCIFNSESPVAAVQRLQPTLSFAFDGSVEGQLR